MKGNSSPHSWQGNETLAQHIHERYNNNYGNEKNKVMNEQAVTMWYRVHLLEHVLRDGKGDLFYRYYVVSF